MHVSFIFNTYSSLRKLIIIENCFVGLIVFCFRFQDAICKSLDTYNTHIEELKNDMDTATRNAEVIHDEMRAFRCRCVFYFSLLGGQNGDDNFVFVDFFE